MNINFELYKVFYYVAKYLSFSEAAAHLFISQSAVSQAIKLLEKSLGCQLFTRTTKHVALTEEGIALYQHIEQAFQLIKSGEQNIKAFQELEQGEIRIGASDTISKYFLLPYLKEFHQLYPKIKINITNRTSPACIELLHKNLLDLAVINLPPQQLSKNIAVQQVLNIQDVFLVGGEYTYLSKEPLSISALQAYPFLLLEEHSVSRMFFEQLLLKYGMTIVPEIELGSLDLLIELTKIGLGISFAVKEFVAAELEKGEVQVMPIREEIPPRAIGLLTPAKIAPSNATSKFIELLL